MPFLFEQPIGQQIYQLQNFILKHLHHHTFFIVLFEEMFNAHQTHILSYFGFGQTHGLQHMSSHVSITFDKNFHDVLDLVQTPPSFDCMFSSLCLHLTH
jgi:hypothetical protein